MVIFFHLLYNALLKSTKGPCLLMQIYNILKSNNIQISVCKYVTLPFEEHSIEVAETRYDVQIWISYPV